MQPAQRFAWSIIKQGSLENLSVINEPVPELRPGQALVAVKAIGLNFADVFCCLGLYQAAPSGSFIPGLEFAGEVLDVRPTDDLSPNTAPTSIRPGDRVLGVTRFGAFATHIALDTRYLRTFTDSWSYQEAASFAVQTLTAAYGLFSCGGLRKGSTVLVQAAAGGVGLQALQILHKLQCNVLGLAGSQDKVQLLNAKYCSSPRNPSHHQSSTADGTHAGAAPDTNSSSNMTGDMSGMDSSKAGAEDQITVAGQLTGSSTSSSSSSSQVSPSAGTTPASAPHPVKHFLVRQSSAPAIKTQLSTFLSAHHLSGFDIILDSVAGPYFQPSYDALNPCGRHVVFGAAALTPPPGTSLERSWHFLAPQNLLAAVTLLLGWVRRPKLDVLAMPGHNKGVIGFNLIWLYGQVDLMNDLYDQVEQLQLEPPLVGAEFGWDQLPEALSYLQSGRSVGKVVVMVSSSDPRG